MVYDSFSLDLDYEFWFGDWQWHRNFLVKALTDNDHIEARRVISSGFISVGVLSAVFLIGVGISIYYKSE